MSPKQHSQSPVASRALVPISSAWCSTQHSPKHSTLAHKPHQSSVRRLRLPPPSTTAGPSRNTSPPAALGRLRSCSSGSRLSCAAHSRSRLLSRLISCFTQEPSGPNWCSSMHFADSLPWDVHSTWCLSMVASSPLPVSQGTARPQD